MRAALIIIFFLLEVGGKTAFWIWPRAALVENKDCNPKALPSSGAFGDFNRTCEQRSPSGLSMLPAQSTTSTGALSGDCFAFSALNTPVRGVWKAIKEPDVNQCSAFEGVPVYIVRNKRLYDAGVELGLHTVRRRRDGQVPIKYLTPPCRPGRHGSPYRPQAYVSSSAPAFDAEKVLAALAGKHLLFLGDSVMRQMMEVFVCSLADAGHKATNVTVSVNQEMQVMYANGLVISRWALLHITPFARRSLHLQVSQADVILTGFGRHYNHSSSRAGYTSDLELLATTLQSAAPRRAVLVETLPAHFPTASGDIFDPKRHAAFAMKEKKGYYVCRKMRARGKMWQNKLMHQVASEHNLPVLQVHDIFAARWDAHQGWRGPGDVFRKFGQDCVHWCYSRFLFRPIIAAMQETILAATSCNSTTPAMPLGSDTRRTFVQAMIDKRTQKEAARASSSG